MPEATKRIAPLLAGDTFPWALVEAVAALRQREVVAVMVQISASRDTRDFDYALILDRISHVSALLLDLPEGRRDAGCTARQHPLQVGRRQVFRKLVAASVGAATPRTVLVPHKRRPSSTEAKSFRNLRFVDWNAVFDYLKSPILLKPAHGGALEDVHKVDGPGSFFGACDASRDLMMMPQEALVFFPSRSPLSSTSPRLSTAATNNDRTSIYPIQITLLKKATKTCIHRISRE